jgi:hypothetical protein
VARGTYLSGTNGSVSFNATGTDYTIEPNGDNMRISITESYGYGQYYTSYLRQTSDTAVTMSWNNSKNNWKFYPVTYDIP